MNIPDLSVRSKFNALVDVLRAYRRELDRIVRRLDPNHPAVTSLVLSRGWAGALISSITREPVDDDLYVGDIGPKFGTPEVPNATAAIVVAFDILGKFDLSWTLGLAAYAGINLHFDRIYVTNIDARILIQHHIFAEQLS